MSKSKQKVPTTMEMKTFSPEVAADMPIDEFMKLMRQENVSTIKMIGQSLQIAFARLQIMRGATLEELKKVMSDSVLSVEVRQKRYDELVEYLTTLSFKMGAVQQMLFTAEEFFRHKTPECFKTNSKNSSK